MKKFVTIFIALLYLGTTTGATFHKHYCMGEPAGWGIGYEQSTMCDNCGMVNNGESDNGCCKDEQKFIKNDSDQRSTLSSMDFSPLSPQIGLHSGLESHDFKIPTLQPSTSFYHSPPLIKVDKAYILYCVFRI